MSFNRLTFNAAFLGIALSGCTSYQYLPSHHYVNLHKQKGEANLSINVMPVGMQAGYSVTDNFFVFGTAYRKQKNARPYRQKEGGLYESHQGNSNEINLGLGYIYRKGKFVGDVMAGGGTGWMNYEHNLDAPDFNYNFKTKTRKNNFFVEPLLGWIVNDNVELGIFFRINSVRYFHINATSTSTNMEEADLAFANHQTMDILFQEPGIFFNLGWPHAKFNLQIVSSDEIFGHDIRNKALTFRSGLSVKIGPKLKK
jgi:hypothetical protein